MGRGGSWLAPTFGLALGLGLALGIPDLPGNRTGIDANIDPDKRRISHNFPLIGQKSGQVLVRTPNRARIVISGGYEGQVRRSGFGPAVCLVQQPNHPV